MHGGNCFHEGISVKSVSHGNIHLAFRSSLKCRAQNGSWGRADVRGFASTFSLSVSVFHEPPEVGFIDMGKKRLEWTSSESDKVALRVACSCGGSNFRQGAAQAKQWKPSVTSRASCVTESSTFFRWLTLPPLTVAGGEKIYCFLLCQHSCSAVTATDVEGWKVGDSVCLWKDVCSLVFTKVWMCIFLFSHLCLAIFQSLTQVVTCIFNLGKWN